MTERIWLSAALLGIVLHTHPLAAGAAAVLQPPDAAQTAVVSDLVVRSTSVSGIVRNQSPATLRGVQLQLRQEFLWNDEGHPGADSPGRVLPLAMAADLGPQASAPFLFHFPSLPERSDGHFVSTMEVTGFTAVGP